MLKALFVIGGALAIWYWLKNLLKKEETQSDARFLDIAIKMIASLLELEAGISKEQAVNSMNRLTLGESGIGLPESIERIDYSLKKVSADQITLAVSILIADRTSGKYKHAHSEADFSWTELPSEIRSQFIKNAGQELAFRLYDRIPSTSGPA